jgi:hypothetical protein
MTEKEMNKLADIVAGKVVRLIESKQQEWDIEFHSDMQHFVSDSTMKVTEEVQSDEVHLESLNSLLSSYIDAEQYEKIAPIKERIKKLEFKINSQK